MILDLIHIHNFHGHAVAGVKVLLFLELIIVLLCMLIIKKDILVHGQGPTQGLDDTTITARDKYHINFTESGKIIALSLHYNGSNSLLIFNAVIVYQFKGKESEIKPYPLCLGNISNNSTIINMKKTGLKGSVHVNSVNSKTMGTSNFLNIYKYLMKKS